MPGVMEKTVSSNNWDMAFKALEELTVGREKNRGTIEVVKRDDLGGMVEGDAGAVTLKCSHHRFYSRGLDTVSARQASDLNSFVQDTVIEVLNDISDKLQLASPEQATQIKARIANLIGQFRNEIDQFTRPGSNGSNRTMNPLSREQIKTIVLQVKDIKAMTAERLLNSGLDSVENIKNWAKGELSKLPRETNVRAKFSTLLTAFAERPDVSRAAVLGKAERGVDVLDSFLGSALDTIKHAKSNDDVRTKVAELLKTSNLDASFPGVTERIKSVLDIVPGRIDLKFTDLSKDVNLEQNWHSETIAQKKPSETQENQPKKSLLLDEGTESIRKEVKVELKDATEVKLPKALENACFTYKNGNQKSYKEIIEKRIRGLQDDGKKKGYEFRKEYAVVLQNLTNDDWVRGAAQKVSKTVNLEHCDAIDVMESLNLVDLERDPFVPSEKGQSSEAARDFAELYKDKDTGKPPIIYVMIFADGHYCMCGLPTGWNTQEEYTLGKSDCSNVAWLMENDFVKLDIVDNGNIRFAYTGKDGLTTTKGGYAVNGVVNGVNARMGFSSIVSLTMESASYDIKGNADWASWAAGITTEAERSNLKRFITALYAMNDGKELKRLLEEYKLSYNQDNFTKIMKAAVFAKSYELYRQSKGGSDEDVKNEVTKMVRYLCENLASKEPSKEFLAFQAEVERKYQESLMVGLGRQFAASVKSGSPVVIGGPIGAGAFQNKKNDIAKASALGFFLTGGKTDYGYPVYDLTSAKFFRKAFVAVPMVLKAMKAKLGVSVAPGSAEDKAITRMLIEKYKAEFDTLYDVALAAIDEGKVYDQVETVDGLKDQKLLQNARNLATAAVEKAIENIELKMEG